MTRTPVPTEFKTSQTYLTNRQFSFIKTLLDERAVEPKDGKTVEDMKREAEQLTKVEANAWIEKLLKLPKLNIPRQGSNYPLSSNRNCPLPDVPEGRYAVEHDGTLKFYKVDKPTEGKWAGFTFLKVQASDDWHPIKAFDYKREVLTSIAVDPRAASVRYGHEIGSCGICGRTLTDEDSRARGIGPICAGKVGWL